MSGICIYTVYCTGKPISESIQSFIDFRISPPRIPSWRPTRRGRSTLYNCWVKRWRLPCRRGRRGAKKCCSQPTECTALLLADLPAQKARVPATLRTLAKHCQNRTKPDGYNAMCESTNPTKTRHQPFTLCIGITQFSWHPNGGLGRARAAA